MANDCLCYRFFLTCTSISRPQPATLCCLVEMDTRGAQLQREVLHANANKLYRAYAGASGDAHPMLASIVVHTCTQQAVRKKKHRSVIAAHSALLASRIFRTLVGLFKIRKKASSKNDTDARKKQTQVSQTVASAICNRLAPQFTWRL